MYKNSFFIPERSIVAELKLVTNVLPVGWDVSFIPAVRNFLPENSGYRAAALKIRGIKDEWKEGTMDFFLLQNEGLLP
jgi:hypothetical protein